MAVCAVSLRGRKLFLKTFVAILLIAACACCTAVSARYATPEGQNAGISPGDTVFNYEQDLNFSDFKNSTNPNLTFDMAYNYQGTATNPQSLDANALLVNPIDAGSYPGYYYPYYSDGTWGSSRITIADATIGDLQIRPVNTDVTPPSTDDPLTTIPLDMNVQFKLKSTNLNSGNFTNPWYQYKLTSLSSGRTWQNVVNAAGNIVSLTDLIESPTVNNDTLAFNMSGQGVTLPQGTTSLPFIMMFQTSLSTTSSFPTGKLSFSVKSFTPAAVFFPSNTTMGQDVILQISGKPYTHYTVYNTTSMANFTPQFSPTGTYDIYTSPYNVTVHPGPDGLVNVTLHVPDTGSADSTTRYYYYKIYETDYGPDISSRSATALLVVGPGTSSSVTLTKPDLALNEFFAVGDTIYIPVTVGSDVKTVYFFMTGPNTCPNGVRPSRPWVCAVDGDNSTFDVMSINPGALDTTFVWDTANTSIASGTYRVFGVTTPTGYLSRTLAVDNAEDYADIDLANPSINAKFPDEAPGFFAKGDYLVSLWTARGSPEKTGLYYGKIRWYIFGINYRYTGITQFPLLKTDSTSPTSDELAALSNGRADYPGYSGLNLGRDYSNSLDDGDYFVVYQHPMYNNAFDLYPEQGSEYTGAFSTILTSKGQSVDISTMQTNDALTAMLKLLNQSKIDDSLLTDHFTIQDPLVTLNPLLNYEVGDDISIKGKTNLEESISYPYFQIDHPADKVTLSVYSSEMYYAGKTQSTYRIYSTEGTISGLAPGATKREIKYDIPAAITATMKTGEYVLVVSCEDIKYSTAFTFVLHEQGYRKKNGLAEPAIGSDFTASNQNITALPTTAALAAATVTEAPQAGAAAPVVTIPTATKSPGFDAASGVAVIAAVAVLYRRSR